MQRDAERNNTLPSQSARASSLSPFIAPPPSREEPEAGSPALPRAASPQGRVQLPVQAQTRAPAELAPREVYAPVYSNDAAPAVRAARPRRAGTPEDPYAPLGQRAGAFILRPQIEAGVGLATNVNAVPETSPSATFTRVAPRLEAESQWSRHQLDLRLAGERLDYWTGDFEAQNNLDLGADARVDMRRDTTLDLGIGFLRRQDSSATTTSTLPGTAVGRPVVSTINANAALERRAGVVGVRLRGTLSEDDFGSIGLADGSMVVNDARDVQRSGLSLRGMYDDGGRVQPFVELGYNRQDYDIEVDGAGLRRGSHGARASVGAVFAPDGVLSGELAVGLLSQTPYEPSFDDFYGLALDGALTWQVTALTALRLNASSTIINTTFSGSAGGVGYDTTLTLAHALRRNVTLEGTLALGYDDFAGIDRQNLRYGLGLGGAYALNRTTQLRARVNHQRLDSSAVDEDVSGSVYELGIRLAY